MRDLKLFLLVLPVFLLVDLTWLGVVMKNFYSSEFGDLMRRRDGGMAPRWGAALLVYFLIPGGLVLFVRPLVGPDASYLRAATWGAVFGLVLYGVYDLTNLATLEKWSLRVTIADMIWGTVLSAVMACWLRFLDGKLA